MERSTMKAGNADRPDGPASAALLAAGVGSLVLGVLTTLAETSKSFADSLAFTERVGPLSGKVVIAVAAFVFAWLVAGFAFRKKDLPLRTAATISTVLITLGLLGTFPIFFRLFAGE